VHCRANASANGVSGLVNDANCHASGVNGHANASSNDVNGYGSVHRDDDDPPSRTFQTN